MTLDEIAKVMADNIRLRDKLLSIVRECAECAGTGVIAVRPQDQAIWGRELPCPDCEDIREILK
jgi:hypothetical protein